MTPPLKKSYAFEDDFGGEFVQPLPERRWLRVGLAIGLTLAVILAVELMRRYVQARANPSVAVPTRLVEEPDPAIQDADPRAAPEPLLEAIPGTPRPNLPGESFPR